ncbi:MAG: Trm112 family protein [Myxococcales bacterium]|nr:Trm112 family protein [Myxococcales bacterium]
MAIDEGLLDLLVCPETREKLSLADAELVAKVNAAITAGQLKNRRGAPVKGAIDGGLVRPDRKVLYAVQDDIPNLLVDDAIPLDQL